MYFGLSNLNPIYDFFESFRRFLRTLANFAVGEFAPSEARRFSKGFLSRRRPFPTDKPQFVCHQTSNPAYFSTSSEKMEFAQANHSRLNSYSLLALMLSCMK